MNAHALPFLTSREIQCFWERVQKTDDCWLWIGTRIPIATHSPHEYGVFNLRRNGRRFNVKAHRVAKALITGDKPSLDIDHICKNKLCVNPDHLEWVTRRISRVMGPEPLKFPLELMCPVHRTKQLFLDQASLDAYTKKGDIVRCQCGEPMVSIETLPNLTK
jgi:hypothetical protein